MAGNVTCQVIFVLTMVAPNPPVAVTTPAPAAVTTTLTVTMMMVPVAALVAAPTAMHVTSRAAEFDNGDDGPPVIAVNFSVKDSGQSGIVPSLVVHVSTSVSKPWIQATC